MSYKKYKTISEMLSSIAGAPLQRFLTAEKYTITSGIILDFYVICWPDISNLSHILQVSKYIFFLN